LAASAIETSILAILNQNGFKVLEKSRSSNTTWISAKKGRIGGKKIEMAIHTSDDLMDALEKERELHRKKGVKQKILFTLCETCLPSFADITLIKDPTELSQVLAS
ncbi:MAG: hypothetical protein ACFFB3_15940, partial [Candidatus Hodarchaeota archaeon]